MFIGDLVLELKGDPENNDPAVFADDIQVTLPASMTGILMQRVADFIVIRDPQSDFYLKWDGKEAVYIRVSSVQTMGLPFSEQCFNITSYVH